MRDKFPPHRIRDRRSLMFEAREARAQRAFTRSSDFVSDRIVVAQIERA